jgi:hypothetical protein
MMRASCKFASKQTPDRTDLCPAGQAADDAVLLQAGGMAVALPE